MHLHAESDWSGHLGRFDGQGFNQEMELDEIDCIPRFRVDMQPRGSLDDNLEGCSIQGRNHSMVSFFNTNRMLTQLIGMTKSRMQHLSLDVLTAIFSFLFPFERSRISSLCKSFARSASAKPFWDMLDFKRITNIFGFNAYVNDSYSRLSRLEDLQLSLLNPSLYPRQLSTVSLLPEASSDVILGYLFHQQVKSLVADSIVISENFYSLTAAQRHFIFHDQVLPLRELALSYHHGLRKGEASLFTFTILSCSKNLAILKLPCNEPHLFELAAIVPGLKELHVQHICSECNPCTLNHLKIDHINSFPYFLKVLDLGTDVCFSEVFVTRSTFINLLANFPMLYELTIGIEGLNSYDISLIVEKLPRLQKLDLGIPGSESRVIDISSLASLSELKSLSLRRFQDVIPLNSSRGDVWLAFDGNFSFFNLQQISIHNLYISVDNLKSVIGNSRKCLDVCLSSVDNIISLELSNLTRLFSLKMEEMPSSFVKIYNCPRLENLDLHECANLENLQIHCSSLKSFSCILNLYQITDLQINCPELEYLDIFFRSDFCWNYCIFLNQWWERIRCPKVIEMFLVIGDNRHSPIGDDCREFFRASCPKLTQVYTSYS